MTATAKALLHTWTVFCIVTAETLNNRTKLANTVNHPLGWYEYCCQISWQSGWSSWRKCWSDNWMDRQPNELFDIMILYHCLHWEFYVKIGSGSWIIHIALYNILFIMTNDIFHSKPFSGVWSPLSLHCSLQHDHQILSWQCKKSWSHLEEVG